jgi:hypothetical protein
VWRIFVEIEGVLIDFSCRTELRRLNATFITASNKDKEEKNSEY